MTKQNPYEANYRSFPTLLFPDFRGGPLLGWSEHCNSRRVRLFHITLGTPWAVQGQGWRQTPSEDSSGTVWLPCWRGDCLGLSCHSVEPSGMEKQSMWLRTASSYLFLSHHWPIPIPNSVVNIWTLTQTLWKKKGTFFMEKWLCVSIVGQTSSPSTKTWPRQWSRYERMQSAVHYFQLIVTFF